MKDIDMLLPEDSEGDDGTSELADEYNNRPLAVVKLANGKWRGTYNHNNITFEYVERKDARLALLNWLIRTNRVIE